MEMIAMLNGLHAAPRTANDYLEQGLSRTISSNVYAGLGGVPMSPEQAMLVARANTVVDSRYSARLGALPMSAREYAMASGMNQVTSGAMWARNGGSLMGIAAPKNPWLAAGALLVGLAAVGWFLKRK
jgi:hypothetical protein